jgi:membrane fusion protein, macrolide-specific efflux system
MKRRKLLVIIAIVVIALAAGIFYGRYTQVDLIDVKRGNIQEAIYGLGKVKSNQIYELKPGVTGSILDIYVREGDRVTKGQKLLRFDDRGIATAPFDGTVTSLPFHISENVFPQTVVLRIEDLKDLYIEVALEQQGALRVKPKQIASISLESLRGVTMTGIIESVFPKDDQFMVRVKAAMFPPEVIPGMTADIAITVGEKKDVLLVPLGSVSNGRLTVFRDRKKLKLAVKIGAVDGDWAEVLEGDIKADDQVVLPKRNI